MDTKLAQEIITKTQQGVETLIGRKWAEISMNLEEDEEIKLGISVKITNRTTAPGEHSDASNRIKIDLSFSKRITDTIETQLEDGSQPELSLSGPAHVPITIRMDDETGEVLEVHSDPEHATVNVGEAIHQAAAQNENRRIHIPDFERSDWSSQALIKAFRKAAKTSGWSAAEIDTIETQLKACDGVTAMQDTLRSHVLTADEEEVALAGKSVGATE